MKVFATLCLAGAAAAYKLAESAKDLEVSQLSQKDALLELLQVAEGDDEGLDDEYAQVATESSGESGPDGPPEDELAQTDSDGPSGPDDDVPSDDELAQIE